MDRRTSLRLMATASLASGVRFRMPDWAGWTEPAFFTEHEFETVRVLVDLILPADERSGSATDAGVPEFMDFMMIDQPDLQLPMRGGLAWLDHHSQRGFGKTFVALADVDRRSILDEIAWPDDADPAVSQGVAFFTEFRDLTATGFWSSRMGVEDLQYSGNVYIREWNGCPEAVLRRLKVRHAD